MVSRLGRRLLAAPTMVIKAYRLPIHVLPGAHKRARLQLLGAGHIPGDDLLSQDLSSHYHRRYSVSLPGSEWDRVVPPCSGHQRAILTLLTNIGLLRTGSLGNKTAGVNRVCVSFVVCQFVFYFFGWVSYLVGSLATTPGGGRNLCRSLASTWRS